MRRMCLLCLWVLSVATLAESTTPWAAADDEAARGLAMFIQAPEQAPAGSRLPVQVRVFGFPTVATLHPVGGAEVEARWDPESLSDGAKIPPPATVNCNQAGLGHLDILVPPGKDTLKLLVAARFAGHERTRTLTVRRTARFSLDLRVGDTRVVPGGTVSAWVLARDRVTGLPAGNRRVALALREGEYTRIERRLTTDRSGMASVEVPIPFVEDPDWKWTLAARAQDDSAEVAESKVSLGVREETPQAPSLVAKWDRQSAAPGSEVAFMLEARDGAGHGIAGLRVRYWIGESGHSAPEDDHAWLAASNAIVTDVDGRSRRTVATPRLVSSHGSSVTLTAKSLVDGRPLVAHSTLVLATPRPQVDLTPELGVLVPGLSQRLFIRASLQGRPTAATFMLDGHGLHASVETNARGLGEVRWQVPRDVGAHVPADATTDCAGGVAATVHIRWQSPAAGSAPSPFAKQVAFDKQFDRCVRVDRDAAAVVRPDQALVVAGRSLGVHILGAGDRGAGDRGASHGGAGDGVASLVLRGQNRAPWQSVWLGAAERGGAVKIPANARGRWTLGASGIPLHGGAHVLGASVLVVPEVLPRLVVVRAGSLPVNPGANVTIEATLDDGHGHPLTGSVGAVVFDKSGGAHPERLLALDTRHALVASAGIADKDIDAFLDGDKAFDLDRWAALAGQVVDSPKPTFDPPATVHDQINDAFRRIVQSLEGAVLEASDDPEQLRDVRVRTAHGDALNPEMLSLVTQAMGDPPVTPGGEPWTLGDLMRVDAQVRYDIVAKRVARLKLFNLLSLVRSYLFDKKLDRDEPILRDPNALLRRMVREETLTTGALLDPWGHGMRFVRATGARVPFLSMVPGYRLTCAGPDGRFGTGDDVRDPFQRVLASGTPYAQAVDEDRIVDARWDMRVGDETVEAWKSLLEELTGRSLGDQGSGGLGLASLGGSGSGYGAGVGGLGGRASHAIDVGSARWLPPVRTDENGRARLTVPLGDAETTWQVVLVAMPDGGAPATASIEIPTALPLSVRADTGAAWILGDQVEVAVRVRNRTNKALSAMLHVSASQAAHLDDDAHSDRKVSIPAQSAATITVPVRGVAVGTGVLEASVEANGLSDRIRQLWSIRAAGEVVPIENATWIGKSGLLPVPVKLEATAAPTRTEAGQVVLERGLGPVLSAALDALAPEQLAGPRAFADAMEVFARVYVWALAHGGESSLLAVRSRSLARQASEREAFVRGQGASSPRDEPVRLRAEHWSAIADPRPGKTTMRSEPKCPSTTSADLEQALDWLAIASTLDRRGDRACWAALRASLLGQIAKQDDPLMLARAVLAFIDVPAQTQVAASLGARLLAAVPLRADGTPVLPADLADHRAARAIVTTALARTTRWWPAGAQSLAGKLWSRLYLGRDLHGGYGSFEATRVVVSALLLAERDAHGEARVRYTELSGAGKVLASGTAALAPSGATKFPLSAGAASVRFESTTPGVLARVVQRRFRSFLRPVDPSQSPLHLDISMAKSPVVGGLASLQIMVRHDLGRPVPIAVRIPLPPGAALADKIDHVAQVQGALYVRLRAGADNLPRIIEVPLRFALAGRVTMPEATARATDDDVAPARAPARPFVVLKH